MGWPDAYATWAGRLVTLLGINLGTQSFISFSVLVPCIFTHLHLFWRPVVKRAGVRVLPANGIFHHLCTAFGGTQQALNCVGTQNQTVTISRLVCFLLHQYGKYGLNAL